MIDTYIQSKELQQFNTYKMHSNFNLEFLVKRVVKSLQYGQF